MRHIAMLAAALVMSLTLAVTAQNNKAETLLGTGLHQEEVEGNCKEAIKTYEKIIQDKSAPKPVAARAQLHIGVCQEKLGQAEARTTYQSVLAKYADQTEVATQAQSRLAKIAGVRTERVWDGPNIDGEGRPFADGRYFVYSDWSSGLGNLAIRDLQTGQKRLLTTGSTYTSWVENPLPSLDGKQIAYRAGENNSSIWVINADGTNRRDLLRDQHDHYLQAWSPDSKHIAAVRNNKDQTHTIVLISTRDGSVQQLKSTGTDSPAVGGYSPDGKFLVYARDNDPKVGDGGVFTLSANGTVQHRLVEGSKLGPTTFGNPFWSPDGKRIVFISNRSGQGRMWSIRVVDGKPQGEPEQLAVNVGNDARGFTRDGSFYYLQGEIQVEAYAGGFDPEAMKVLNYKPITDQAIGNNRGPELSPDGTMVAFIRRRSGMPWAVMVRSFSADSEERVVGTINGSGAYGARTLQWFPDGRSLLVIDRVDGPRTRFRRIDLESGEATLVFDGPWHVWTGAVSYDGKDVFYSHQPEEDILRLVKRRLDTGEEKELYRVQSDGAGFFGLIASPDGASLTFALNIGIGTGQRALMALSTDGGAPRELYRNGIDGNWPVVMNWTSDSRTIVVGAITRNGHSLYAIPPAGGSLKPLGLNMEEIQTPAISPDGKRIVFGGRTVRRELWVVRNLLADLEKAR